MKKINYLKGLRVTLAILIFVPILLYFLDIRRLLPDSLHAMMHIQLMPAVLGGMLGLIIFQLLLVIIFGRIYCSTICPAGILQDIINRCYTLGKKGKKRKRRFVYHKPMNLLRYSILGITWIGILFGFMELALLLDPYSTFGRIASNIFYPVGIWINNMTASMLMKIDNYSFYNITIQTITAASFTAALVALITFVVLTIWRGRLFCNSICPVGTLLGLFSKYSLFRISFDGDACTNCGNCEHGCKAEAIDSKKMTVDTSRCVDCFNCISKCAKGGLQYRMAWKSGTKSNKMQEGRRGFLATGAVVAASIPGISVMAQGRRHRKSSQDKLPITPPGSVSLAHFKDKCTACQLCVMRCPTKTLKPTGLEYGFSYMLRPEMNYDDSYCNYECTVCSDVCPTGAIRPLTVEEKITTQVGIAHFYKGRCVVYKDEQDCGACAEHCPTQAVHMVPYKGTLTIPKVTPDLCIGCGGCESICPVRPNRAIIIKANEVQQQVAPPEKEEVKDIEVDDFGF